jgi:hypothetical protein
MQGYCLLKGCYHIPGHKLLSEVNWPQSKFDTESTTISSNDDNEFRDETYSAK